MLAKIVVLFLVFVAVLGMVGKLKMRNLPGADRLRRLRAARCPACGRHRIGKGPCPCGRENS